AAGLFHYHWPIKPTTTQIERLLGLPLVKGDLALAAGIVGLFSNERLKRLASELTDDAIVASLLTADHGWDEICRLPPETPALELAWLQRVEKADYKRYVVLAGRALGTLHGGRLDKFVAQLPRRHRPAVFLAAIRAHES